MMRDMVLDREVAKHSQFAEITSPLFDTKLDSSKKVVELSDADLRLVGGGGNCGVGGCAF